MTATYQQVANLPSELIRVPARGAVAGKRSRPALTFQSTGPTLKFQSADSVLRALRARGLRISTARRMIVNYLFEAGAPVSAQQIAAGLDRTPLDLASVYRNLETLEEIGVVRHFHAGHGAGRYVLVGGGEREYLACDRCGAIAEIDRSELDPLREDVHERFGYEVAFTHFPMVGLCPRCAKGEGGSSS
jgi:Fur family transcriptional regulator, ferric uptake regulator